MNTKVMPENNTINTENPHKNRNPEETKAYRKANIPKALREQVWIKYMKNRLHGKCVIVWCKNKMSAFDFHVGHDIPESKGGTLDITNLRPICARCNLSMSNNYTISEWEDLQGFPRKWWHRFICFT
jgi:5-methylcytosine-specific restriction endonuclease McrA